MLLRKEKKQRHWEEYDYGLAQAIDILDRERCKKCGLDAWHAYSENDQEIMFKIVEHTCHGCAHLEQHEHKKSDKAPKKFGVTEMVEAVHTDTTLIPPVYDTPLPGREPWLEEMRDKRK